MPYVVLDVIGYEFFEICYFGAASLIIKASTLLGLSSIMWQLNFLFDDKAQIVVPQIRSLTQVKPFFAKLDVIMKVTQSAMSNDHVTLGEGS